MIFSDNMNLIYRILFNTIVIFGCLYQITQILNEYLHYRTSTSVIIKMPDELEAPNVSYCIRQIDIFNFEEYEKMTNIRIINKKGMSSTELVRRFMQLV